MWKLAVVKLVITGRDGIVRAAQLKTTNGYLERAIQHLFPLELNCNVTPTSQLNPTALEYQPRPRRDAAAAALLRVKEISEQESKEH
jgi:hypothetical protein